MNKIAINTLAMKSFKHGMGTYIGNLINHVLETDKKNEYLLYVSEINFPNLKIPPDAKVKIKFIPKNRVLRILWEQILLPIDLLREKVDLFHGPAFTAPLFKTSKQLITIHDMTWWTHPEAHEGVKVWYFKTMIRLCARRADCITVNSQSTKNDLMRIIKVQDSKIVLIYHAANERFLPVTDNSRLDEVKKRYQLPERFIFFVSVLEPRKNLNGLIRAFAGFRDKHPELSHRLIIGGGRGFGWKNESIFKLVEDLGLKERVRFLGFVPDDDLPAIYSLADLFVLPSFYEGFGVPVLEAMMCGCPVITSNVSSLPEVADDAAVLIDPYDIDQLTLALEKVLDDPKLRQSMSSRGLINARRFSWGKVVRETLDLYERILRDRI